MYFVSEKCGRMILDMVGCDKGIRSWLEEKVLSYKLEPKKEAQEPMPTNMMLSPGENAGAIFAD